MNNQTTTTKVITDQEILDVYENKDYWMIMRKASFPFSTILSPEEIESCKKKAIWRSLINFNPSKNTKYATYLYRGVFLECRTNASFIMNHRRKSIKSKKHKTEEIRVYGLFNGTNMSTDLVFDEPIPMPKMVELMDEINSTEDGHILIDFYINGLSYEEIAQKNSIQRSDVTQRKNKVLRKLKKSYFK